MNELEKYAAKRKLITKLSAWAKLANPMVMGPPKPPAPPSAPGRTTKGAGIPAPKNPVAKMSKIKGIKTSMNTRGAMPS